MSNFSHGHIQDIGSLYESVYVKDQDFLNEESEYYDAEATEIVEDIISTISTLMVYEGYSANAVLSFLADASEEDILEKYFSFNENILYESRVSEEYIEEQLEILDFAISEGLGGLFKGAINLIGRVASKPARMKAAGRLLKSNNPQRTAAAYQKLANKNANKAGLKAISTDGAPASVRFKNTDDAVKAALASKAITKVKDVAKGAKAALTSPTAKKIAAGALALGTGVGIGYLGGKGSNSNPTAASTSSTLSGAPPAPILPPPYSAGGRGPSGSGAGGGGSSGRGSGSGGGNKSATPSKNVPAKPATKPFGQTLPSPDATSLQKYNINPDWAAANPRLAQVEVKRAEQHAAGKSTFDPKFRNTVINPILYKDYKEPKLAAKEKQDQTPTTGPERDLQAELEKQRKKAEQNKVTQESYEPYDIILEYLSATGQVDTIEEAHYIMLLLDENAIASIMEKYNEYLLSEELSELANHLLYEGYDLSEYSWDDIVDYYLSEV